MKGYKLDKTLYIFDATPAAIPVSVDDVDIIYVQQELLAAYVNANQDAASKIKPYNYKLLAVNKLPWADYIDNDLDDGSSETQYTVSANFGQTLLEYLRDSLPFEPSMPYSATAGTQLVFTLPWEWGWLDNREGNTDSEFKIQIQVPESIQDSYEIVWPYEDGEDPENPVYHDGTLAFTMPAEDVTLNIDFVENPDYNPEPDEPEEPEEPELPETGTVYDFYGYAIEESGEQTSTGTVTYNGIYEGTPESDLPTDGTYIWGTATVTFTGASESINIPVFIGKDSLSTIDTGTRVQVWTLKQDAPTQTESIGFVEIYTQNPEP